MNKLILAAIALALAPALHAQATRNVHRPAAGGVHRPGHTGAQRPATVNRTTNVNRTRNVNRTTNVNVNRTYRPGNWNRARVNAGVYRYPRGYAYRRWTVGRVLPRVYLAPAYYYPGYAALGLMAPPANYQWVRYGPDLLLVGIATGNVVDIRYGVFG